MSKEMDQSLLAENTEESLGSFIKRTNNICFHMSQKLSEVDKKICDLHQILILIKEKTDKL